MINEWLNFFLYFLHSCSKWSWFVYMYVYQKLISHFLLEEGMSWSYGSWIYNYLCNHCLSPLTLQVRIPLRRGVLDTTLCDIVCQWLAQVCGFLRVPGTLISSNNNTDHYNITEVLLKVALNIVTLSLSLNPFNINEKINTMSLTNMS